MASPAHLRIADNSAFRIIREFLSEAGYNEPSLCGQLGLKHLSDIVAQEPPHQTATDPLARLFFAGAYLSRAEYEREAPVPVREALAATGLVLSEAERVWCPVMLYPAAGLLIASDRLTAPDLSRFEPGDDFVYLAITTNTEHFLEMLPRTPCDAFLDLGAGSGVAAIAAAGYSRHVWAADITPRSCAFAEFNARLNGVDNVSVLCGDVFAPLENLTFDRIVMHPPYEPSAGTRPLYADGGDDGEAVTRRAFEGLSQRLRPGGRFYCLAMCADREGRPLERRIREWIGERQEEFDVAVIARTLTDPNDFAMGFMVSTRGTLDDLAGYIETFRRLQVTQLVYAHMVVERHREAVEPVTLRRQMGTRCTPAEIDWLLDTERLLRETDLMDKVVEAAGSVDLRVRHSLRDGQLVPVEYAFHAQDPFTATLECRGWMAYLVTQAGAQRKVRELFEHMQTKGVQDENVFRAAVSALIAAGVLRLRP